MKELKKIIVGLLPKNIKNYLTLVKQNIFNGYCHVFFSEDGVDIILKRKLKGKIFYVDVGANHPFNISNTYVFYKNGSRGINIDATPCSMDLFKLARKRDINLEIAISDSKKELKYYLFQNSVLNTFSEELAKKRAEKNKLLGEVILKPKRLSVVLDESLPKNQDIDLLSIDVEGHDLNVLKSNDFSKYSPKIIVIEEIEDSIEEVTQKKIYSFLRKKKYRLIGFTGKNSIYKLISH
jgi:FkbM family methyltransferase